MLTLLSLRLCPRAARCRIMVGLGVACCSGAAPNARAGVEIAASTSYVLPGAPARLTEISWAPVALADGGTAYVAKFEGAGEHALVINRPNGLTFVRPAALGLPTTGGGSPVYFPGTDGPTDTSAIYAWGNGVFQTILGPENRFAGEPVSVASFAIGDDQAVAFFDSRRTAS